MCNSCNMAIAMCNSMRCNVQCAIQQCSMQCNVQCVAMFNVQCAMFNALQCAIQFFLVVVRCLQDAISQAKHDDNERIDTDRSSQDIISEIRQIEKTIKDQEKQWVLLTTEHEMKGLKSAQTYMSAQKCSDIYEKWSDISRNLWTCAVTNFGSNTWLSVQLYRSSPKMLRKFQMSSCFVINC